MADVFLGLGSNEGDREENIKQALVLLDYDKGITIKAVSSLYESRALGDSPQPDFINGVVRIETEYAPPELLEIAKSIEETLGRRPHTHILPRPIDIDLLLYDNLDYDSLELRIPHSRLCSRRFVLEPLLEIDNNVRHPVTDEPLSDFLEKVKSQKMIKRMDSSEVWNEPQ
ncbi:MAG: 2-amino-4-hydroxy-6-hydroxymethyldihydropteridine diphosphokinase [Candidatus Zixiibacteriota bacterium]|nr:MAG: 2-amino-4-hydroxy-6-hydroxymethyldihydropteridine diphosphokinase [candidate division Zixibacteria bacterium]